MKIFTLIFFVLAFFAVGNAQQINQITTRCPSPNRAVYASVLINSLGNIAQTPCPSGSNAFTGLFDWTAITSTQLNRTITTAGTVGAQTINKPNGSVNVAAGVGSIVITNNTVATSSLINALANTNDATCSVKNAVATTNTITITMTANCTAETRVAFWNWN